MCSDSRLSWLLQSVSVISVMHFSYLYTLYIVYLTPIPDPLHYVIVCSLWNVWNESFAYRGSKAMLESVESDSCSFTSLIPFTADLAASYQGNSTQSCFLVAPLGSLNYYDEGNNNNIPVINIYYMQICSGVCTTTYWSMRTYKQFWHFHLGDYLEALFYELNLIVKLGTFIISMTVFSL